MCTGLTLRTEDGHTLLGRNMDLEYYFNQGVHIVPRNYAYKNHVTGEECHTKYAFITMATLLGDEKHPAVADGMNEKGLGCAGLNFPDYIYYAPHTEPDKINIGPYDMMLWILSQFDSVAALNEVLPNLNLVKQPFDQNTPIATLHWIVKDTTGACIVIESTPNGLNVYDNLVGVLTNAPGFDYHLTNLNQYVGLGAYQAKDTHWSEQPITPSGHGLGSFGLPGDYSSVSRFVRIALLRSLMPPIPTLDQGIYEFFHLLDAVAMPNGCIIKPHDQYEKTIYTSCMCLEKGIYYYKNYTNNRINAVELFKEDLDAKEIKSFTFLQEEDINYQN